MIECVHHAHDVPVADGAAARTAKGRQNGIGDGDRRGCGPLFGAGVIADGVGRRCTRRTVVVVMVWQQLGMLVMVVEVWVAVCMRLMLKQQRRLELRYVGADDRVAAIQAATAAAVQRVAVKLR